MTRSRLVFILIIGAAILVVVIGSVVNPMLQSRNAVQNGTATAETFNANTTTIKITYSTEKEAWLQAAIDQFKTANPDINPILDGEESMDAYQALSQLQPDSTTVKLGSGDNSIPTVWSPASTIQVNLLNSNNQLNKPLAVECKPLVLSPLVILVWDDRAQVLENYYKDKGGVTFDTLYNALDPSGQIQGKWSALNGNPNWGLIKIGHADPYKSNSGVTMLVAMANNKYQQTKAVTSQQVTDSSFQQWLKTIENAVNPPLISSTDAFVNDVIAKGPSTYDVAIMDESLAIENYDKAKGRQGQSFHIYYPPYNLFSDHPFCLIDDPKITDKQKDAARRLQNFLLSTDIQKLALKMGFRPADTSIPIFSSDPAVQTYFDRLKSAGIMADVGQAVSIPDSNTINNLLTVWRQNFSQ